MMLLLEAASLAPRLWKVVIFLAISTHLSFSAETSIDMHHKIDVGKCLSISKHLLNEVKESLTHPDVTGGFNCSDNVIVLEDITENLTSTVWACSPVQESSGCKERGDPRGCRLSSNQCYQNITTDLQIYQAKLQNFTHITGNVCKHIGRLLKALNSSSNYEDTNFEGGSTTEDEEKHVIDFPQRMVLCKILQAFKLRTITINRVMNYLNDTKL
ncbi:interleukin-12 subunit alpha [Heterodontus francisci]|uniref:interleukin-12 subunit alpha n=1 Tax=Heterodontus francisci TaxID=7792 RepID=UPI00355BEDD9